MTIACLGPFYGRAETGSPFMVTPNEMNWVDALSLQKGAKITVIRGDPSKVGPYIYRIKLPPNFTVAAHTHPDDRIVTVLSGTVFHGAGEKFDATKLRSLPVGSVFLYTAGHHDDSRMAHFYMSQNEEVVLQVQGVGPTAIDFVNSADDPRKR